MKTIRHYVYLAIAIASISSCAQNAPVAANQWNASVIPASLNADQTIRLVGGVTEELPLFLQADKEVLSRSATHEVTLEFDLPPGMTIVGNGGVYQFSEPTTQMKNGRTVIRFKAQIPNNRMLGTIGSVLQSEWQNQSIFVSVPKSVPVGQNYVQVKLTDGDYNKLFSWPLQITAFSPPAQKPKRTPLGLWDYSYSRTNNETTAQGVAALFTRSGITFTESAGDPIYRSALQAAGILTGGNTYHDYFFDKRYADYSPAGIAATGGFADPQSIIALPPDAKIPGIEELVAAAKAGDGIATFDYEPTGTIGFSPAATAEFKKRYNMSDADFTRFCDYVAKNKFDTYKSTDPVIAKIWKQWTEFRTDQTSNYIRRIYQAFKAQLPNGRLAVTPSRSYGKDSLRTLALGCDDAAMAQYTDIIMPQIYCGYGAADAKLAMQTTAGWKQEINDQNAKTQLWPLLLVRYAGANAGNSPLRLRQQIIGSLANGANGIMFYYPGVMDAPYWEMISRTSEDIAKYEDYYQDGKRVDSEFPLSGLPRGNVEVIMWPGNNEIVKNPTWSFTAHQLGSKVLLTLMNLEEANDLVFDVNIGKAKVSSSQNVEKQSDHQWLVAPGQIGFVVLER